MIQKIIINGMTCDSCKASVNDLILGIDGVDEVNIDRESKLGVLTTSRLIPVSEINDRVQAGNSKYSISENTSMIPSSDGEKSWFQTYKPVLLIFTYLLVITLLIQQKNTSIDIYQWMRHFMAGFFLVFSFFKLLNIKGFAESYAMYDLIARKVPVWGYIYVFIELIFGFAYLVDFNPLITNISVFVIMSISIIGVLQSVLNKTKIKCACLGDVFDLPMSTITIIEDGLMILMSLFMMFNQI